MRNDAVEDQAGVDRQRQQHQVGERRGDEELDHIFRCRAVMNERIPRTGSTVSSDATPEASSAKLSAGTAPRGRTRKIVPASSGPARPCRSNSFGGMQRVKTRPCRPISMRPLPSLVSTTPADQAVQRTRQSVFEHDVDVVERGERDQRFGTFDFGCCDLAGRLAALQAPDRRDLVSRRASASGGGNRETSSRRGSRSCPTPIAASRSIAASKIAAGRSKLTLEMTFRATGLHNTRLPWIRH